MLYYTLRGIKISCIIICNTCTPHGRSCSQPSASPIGGVWNPTAQFHQKLGTNKRISYAKKLILIIFTACVLKKLLWPNCLTTQRRWHKWTQSRNVHLREPQRDTNAWIHYRKANTHNNYRFKKGIRTTRQAISSQKLIKDIWKASFRLKKKSGSNFNLQFQTVSFILLY